MERMLDTLFTIVKSQRDPEIDNYYKILNKEYRGKN